MILLVAQPTGFEPAISAVTGRRFEPAKLRLHRGYFTKRNEENNRQKRNEKKNAEGGDRTHDLTLMKRSL
jgi:hypothetical protein